MPTVNTEFAITGSQIIPVDLLGVLYIRSSGSHLLLLHRDAAIVVPHTPFNSIYMIQTEMQIILISQLTLTLYRRLMASQYTIKITS